MNKTFHWLSLKEKNNLVKEYIEIIKRNIWKEKILLGDILAYFEKEKIWIFNYTKNNLTITEYIIRNYLKLDQDIDKQSIHNKRAIVKLFFEFNLLK